MNSLFLKLFHLIFLGHYWLGITETLESEIMDRWGHYCVYVCIHFFSHLAEYIAWIINMQ